MQYQPKFRRNQPKTKEENLIIEISNNLHDIAVCFIRANLPNCTDNEIFITLRDGVMAFAGETCEALTKVMVDPTQKMIFLKECQDIFNCYIQQAAEAIK